MTSARSPLHLLDARMKEIDPSPTVRLTAEVLREVSEAEGEPEAGNTSIHTFSGWLLSS